MTEQQEELKFCTEIPNNDKRCSFFVLFSAIQKAIRRGMEYEAFHWSVRLETYPNIPGPSMLWNRLKVIASEDIGIADPLVPLVIDTLEKEYYDAKRRRNSSYRLFLANAVVYLARAPKSRIVDDLVNVVYHEIENENKVLPFPRWVLDIHTEEGRNLGKGIEDFITEGTYLANEAPNENPYTKRAEELLKKYGKLKFPFKSRKNTEPQLGILFQEESITTTELTV
jgi:replication-associated recombination protein RarA